MTTLYPSFGNTKYVVNKMADGILVDEQTVAISDPGGIVTATWTAFTCTLDGNTYQVAAGSKALHSLDVASATTYYVYFMLVGGVPTCQVSTTNPCVNPAITTDYFITNIVRFTSIVGGATTYYISKYPTQNGVDAMIHNLKEDSMYFEPMWISGIVPSFDTGTGKLTTTSGYVRFPGNEPRAQAATTSSTFMMDDESAVLTDLLNLKTYANAHAMADGEWSKVLVGINRNKGGILAADFMVMRMDEPTVPYASAADAKADAEQKAALGFGWTYLAAVTPICYITGKYDSKAGTMDYSTGEVIDIRETGTTKGSAGGGTVTSHGSLANLNVLADHQLYVALDGSRPLTADWDAGAFDVEAKTFTSDVAIGTAPFTSTSTTMCTNLNADAVDGVQGANIVTADGLTALTGDWDAGSNDIKAETFTSDIATIAGAPFTVTSTTVVTNLNADTVDGHDAAAFLHVDGSATATGALNMGSKSITAANDVGCATVTATGLCKALTLESTQTTGTAPFAVASTTKVTSLNADQLDGLDDTAFLKADGTITLTGNMAVSSGITIDGVDIGVHAATANAHHNAVTLGANTSGILSLSTQAISMDAGVAANTALAGPTSGTAAPTFRQLTPDDLARTSGTLTLANTGNDNVSLTARVRVYTLTGPTSNFSVTGFTGGVDGAVLYLHNGTGKTMTLSNDSSSSSAGNRIYNAGGTIANNATVSLVYIGGTTLHWCRIG